MSGSRRTCSMLTCSMRGPAYMALQVLLGHQAGSEQGMSPRTGVKFFPWTPPQPTSHRTSSPLEASRALYHSFHPPMALSLLRSRTVQAIELISQTPCRTRPSIRTTLPSCILPSLKRTSSGGIQAATTRNSSCQTTFLPRQERCNIRYLR